MDLKYLNPRDIFHTRDKTEAIKVNFRYPYEFLLVRTHGWPYNVQDIDTRRIYHQIENYDGYLQKSFGLYEIIPPQSIVWIFKEK